jgi:hypothetical protein
MTLYRNVLSSAWKNTWRHKYLWFFGLFAALIGNSGELEVFFRSFNDRMEGGFLVWLKEISATGIFSLEALKNIGRLVVEDTGTMFLLIFTLVLVLILSGFLIWLVVASQIAIVNNTAHEKLGKKHNVQIGISAATKRFWPVLGLNFIVKVFAYVLFGVLTLPIAMSLVKGGLIGYGFLFVVLYVVFVPLILFFSFIVKYAIAYAVIKEESFLESIKSAWKLFMKNCLISIEMTFLLFFINLFTAFALILVFLIISVPFLFIAIFSNILAYINFLFIFIGAIILFIIITAFVGSILATFQISAWTYLFIELETKGGVSKLKRLFSKE